MTTDNEEIQKKIVKEILVACDNGNVQQVKSLIGKIDLDCQYSLDNNIPIKIYCHACLTWNIDILDQLIKIPQSYDQDNRVMHSAFQTLINADNVNSHRIIKYLMNDPKLKKNRIKCRGYDSIILKSLITASENGDLPIFKILLNLDDPKKHNKWYFQSVSIYDHACKNKNSSEIMKYICTEPQLALNVSPQLGFIIACRHKNLAVLKYFIFEYKIEKADGFDDPNRDEYCEEATRMFELREINKQLNVDLQSNQELSKKIKV